jgi:hypothetical protein
MVFHKGSGFHPHLPGFKHKFLAKALGASMWFFIFYRARFVFFFLLHFLIYALFFREDGPKLLVRCHFVSRTKPILHCTGFKAPMGGTCTWASWRRSIASLNSAALPSLRDGIGTCRSLCSATDRTYCIQTRSMIYPWSLYHRKNSDPMAPCALPECALSVIF